MKTSHRQKKRLGTAAANLQQGAYAVEFAIVFPIFFLLFYGLLSFGLIFTAQQSLKLAAEDGARATLRYYLPTAAGGTASSLMQQLQGRLAHGCDVAQDRVSWLAQMAGVQSSTTCQAVVTGPCAQANGLPSSSTCTANFVAGATPSAVACGYLSGQQCEATLVVAYGYGSHPIVPVLPGLGFVMPQSLNGFATVTLDPAMLQPAGGA